MLVTNFVPFPELKTERLVLRKLSIEDAPEIFKMRSNDLVMKYIGKERAKTLTDAEVFINRINTSLDINEGITWAMAFENEPSVLIGTIGYWRMMKEHYRAEIGYMLSPDQWRKGIMKEALLKVIDTGFQQLKLHSIEAHINPGNIASASILLSAGFVKEAHFKENFFYDGSFSDTAIYSRLQ